MAPCHWTRRTCVCKCGVSLVKGVLGGVQECPTRGSHKRLAYKSVLQECSARIPARVSHKSALQERPTQESHKSGNIECVCAFGFVGSVSF